MEIETYIQSAAAWAMPLKAVFIKSGGVFNAAFAVFHLLFSRLFNWREDLRTLTFANRCMVRVLNLCVTLVLALFAYVSLAHTRELLSSSLGLTLTASIALFWLVRAVQQVVVFGPRPRMSLWLFLVFVLGALLYGVPAALTAWPGFAAL